MARHLLGARRIRRALVVAVALWIEILPESQRHFSGTTPRPSATPCLRPGVLSVAIIGAMTFTGLFFAPVGILVPVPGSSTDSTPAVWAAFRGQLLGVVKRS
jgi:hypothetical protein